MYVFIFVISGLVFYVLFVVMKKFFLYIGKYNWILYNLILFSEGGGGGVKIYLDILVRVIFFIRDLKYIKKFVRLYFFVFF